MSIDFLVKTLSVLVLAILELWAAIPAGLALGLPPPLVVAVSAFGSTLSALGVILLGDRARSWILSKRGERGDSGKAGRAQRIWDRYGVVGLGLLSPLLFGAPLGAAIGVSLGADTRGLMLWMGIGIAIWSILLTAAGALGIAGAGQLFGH
ncbi:MAG: small multi-drug export protein [Chloroflexota bacterium]|jgi:hypothetical protein